jgi:hypothetical protein
VAATKLVVTGLFVAGFGLMIGAAEAESLLDAIIATQLNPRRL